MELNIYNKEGQDTGRKINLSDDVFGIEPNEHAIYLDVKFLTQKRKFKEKFMIKIWLNHSCIFSRTLSNKNSIFY